MKSRIALGVLIVLSLSIRESSGFYSESKERPSPATCDNCVFSEVTTENTRLKRHKDFVSFFLTKIISEKKEEENSKKKKKGGAPSGASQKAPSENTELFHYKGALYRLGKNPNKTASSFPRVYIRLKKLLI